MSKRILSIALCVLLVAISLCSCKGGDQPAVTTEVTTLGTESATTEAVTTAATTADTTDPEIPEDDGIYIDRPTKKVKNILMIGNSFCFYYVEELAGIAAADGNEIVVANLYKSGCKISEHWNNYTNDTGAYEFYVTNSSGRGKPPITTMQDALEYAGKRLGGDWDVITLQQSCSVMIGGDVDSSKAQTLTYAENLYNAIKAQYPEATYYWHQPWAYQVGYSGIDDTDDQNAQYNAIKAVAYAVAEQNGVNLVVTGDAWQIARQSEEVGDTLCQRTGINGGAGDNYHDGDIGGGQYLNACVWYEILMGESCVGNTWRPSNYELSEETIAVLQNAAHEAVAAIYGPNYAI